MNRLERGKFIHLLNKYSTKILLTVVFMSLLWPALRSISIIQDFHVFYGAAEKLVAKTNIYTVQYIYGYWYYYSIQFAGILAPFTFLPIEFSKTLWAFFNIWLIYRVFKITFEFSGLNKSNSKLLRYSIFILWFIFFYLLYVNITNGQITMLILYFSLEGYKQLHKNNHIASGALISSAINIKMLPIVLVLPWLLKKQYKSLLFGLAFFILLMIIPLFFLDFKYYSELTISWLDKINPFHNDHIEEVGEGGFIDLAGLITKYFCSFKIRDEITISWFNFTKPQLFYTINLLRLALVFMLIRVSKKQDKNNTKSIPKFETVALWLASIPILIPHQRDYSLLFMIPLIACLIIKIYNNELSKIQLTIFAIAILLMGMHPLLFIKNSMLQQIFISFRLQGIGAIVFILNYLALRTSKPINHENK